MCNTNGPTIGAWRQQLSAVATNYFHCIDLAGLQLLSYSEWRRKKKWFQPAFHLCLSLFISQASQLSGFVLASKLSVICHKINSWKCLATWGHKPSRSATETVGGLSMAFAGIKTKQSGGKCRGYSNNLLVLTHISLQITATSICLKNDFLGLANLSIK